MLETGSEQTNNAQIPYREKINEAEGKRKYRVEISYRFTALENLHAVVDIYRALESITENIKIPAKDSQTPRRMKSILKVKEGLSYYELKNLEPWIDDGCSKLLDQRQNFSYYRIQAK
jgi:hypothetical protein